MSGIACSSCSADAPLGSKFCGQCGAALHLPCPSCGNVNAPGSNFCSQCGEKLGAAVAPAPARRQPPAAPLDTALAERRHLTVMFCDLVGSTALSGRLDVEDLREVIGTYQKRVTEVIASFGGTVARYLGDGVLVYFGYPNAHEDDTEQAVRAGLAVVAAVRALEGPEPLEVRLGISTGIAVVGDLLGGGAAHDREIVGEMPNLAARLQALAEPNTIIIAHSTRRLVGSVFDLEDLGIQDLKGFAQPQHVWRVLGEAHVGSRFEALRSTETPLIGREEELDLLLRRWAQVKSGEGRVVMLSSEPGVGKSRLLVAFRERLDEEPYQLVAYFCSPHHQSSALFPIIGQLERSAGFGREDTPETRLEKLEGVFTRTPASPEDIGLFAELLLLPTGRYPALELTPQQKKDRTFDALLRNLTELASRVPVLVIFEDLHWIDPSTRQFLNRAVDRLQALPVLLLATFRPEFQPPWTDEPHVTALNLTRLTHRQAEALVEKLTVSSGPLSADLVHEIVERADGVPLFLEELTKAILEVGPQSDRARGVLSHVPAASVAVPATLQASLMARLDRLGPIAKEIAQIAAAIGREFSFELLAMVAERPQAELHDHLGRLLESGLVMHRGVSAAAEFLFKHALIQDAAYGTLLRGPRARLHGRIAQALEDNFAQVTESRPELVARHLEAAGLRQRAIIYRKRAGELALRRSAAGEALAHFSAALEGVEHLPESPASRELELDVRLGLGAALNTLRGSSHPEVATNYARAVALGRELGDTIQHFRAVWGSWYAAHVTGKTEQGLAFADELVEVAEGLADQDLMLEAYHSRWASSHTLGLNGPTLSDVEHGIALYDPVRHRSHVYQYGGHDTGVCARAHGAMTLWITGFPDQAEQMCEEALALGRRLDHPPSLAHAAWWSATVFQMLRRPEQCRRLAELAVQIAREQGSQIFVTAPVLLGWARFELGDAEGGLRDMEEAIANSRRGVRRWYHDYELLVVAETMLKAGRREEALALVVEALDVIEASGNRLFEAEAYRLRGACSSDAAEAEHWLARALDISQRQDARSLRLRAAMSLAEVRRDQQHPQEANDLLAGAYAEFTEGFGTADIVTAKHLLDQLRSSIGP